MSLPGGDGRKYWEFSLKDSAGDSDGSTGSYVVLDTHGPSCWTPYPMTVRSGGTAILQYKVTDKLSTRAKATIAIPRQDEQRGPDVAGALGGHRQAAGAQGGLRPDPGRLPGSA